MPKFLENDLAAEAQKKGLTGRAAAHYIYGGMNDLGAMHGNQPTAKGARMQAKHVRQEAAGTAAPTKRPTVSLKTLTRPFHTSHATPRGHRVRGVLKTHRP